jgi:sec-independent protein translocase protein TatA
MLLSQFMIEATLNLKSLAFIGTPGPQEMLIVGMIALLLFGKRLPEVARNLGKGFSEFKKGMSGFQEEIRTASRDADRSIPYSAKPAATDRPSDEDRPAPVPSSLQAEDEFAAPKFDVD